METKVCKKCKRELALDMFQRCKLTADGYKYTCRECVRAKLSGKRGPQTNPNPKNKRKYKWMCLFDDPYCNKSAIYGICCHECSKRANCEMACKNVPEKCGALLNEQIS